MMMTREDLKISKSLVGDTITQENLKFIDCFVSSKLSMFMPVGGHCGYAVTPDHQHPAYMFVLSYDHETEVVIDGRRVQSSPNSIFCLSPNIQHHEVQNYLPPKYCAIFIDVALFEKSLKNYTPDVVIFNGLVVEIKSSKLDILVRDFIVESYNKHISTITLLESIATLITHEIIRNIVDYNPNKIPLTDNLLINEAIKFINIKFEQEITIEILAKLSCLSKSHFTKCFTDEMKVSPMTYLKMIRLQNAKKMLRAKELTITQVATQCGFNSTSYFSKQFKEAFNETPKIFMQKIK